MKLRPAELSDYTELAKMYKELSRIVYFNFELKDDIYFYGIVMDWFKFEKNVVVCETDDGKIAGFTLAYVEDIGIIDPYYYGDVAYVKEEYRKTKAAYLLYNNVVKYGKSLGMKVIAKAFVGNGNKNRVDKIQEKFGKPVFIEFMTEETDG